MGQDMVRSSVPRPPSYAWDWLQRSRPVVQALAERLTGQLPTAAFVDELRVAFDEDRFVHAVVIDTVAEVAFAGRVPAHRPAGTNWDRGLSWWAATLAGKTRKEFEQPVSVVGRQPELFASASPGAADGVQAASSPTRQRDQAGGWHAEPAPRPSAVVTLERRRIANVLRSLLTAHGGDDVPVDAVRQLIHDLESPA